MISDDGKQLGIMKTFDALRIAREANLDLVEVGPMATPPIAKIMDYGKYQYQKEKEEKARPKIKQQLTKSVRVGFKTGEHDLAFKAKQADGFLNEGHWVRVEVTLRGREKAFAARGLIQMEHFLSQIKTPYSRQGEPKRGPYGWVLIIQKSRNA